MADIYEVKHPRDKFVDAASDGSDVNQTITTKWAEQSGGDYAPQIAVGLPSTIYNGQKTVTAAGTAEALAGSQAITSGVHVKALLGNTDIVYVGDSGVSSANGLELNPGESVFVEVSNLLSVFVDSAVNGEGVSYLAT